MGEFGETGEVLAVSIPFQDNEADLSGGYARVLTRASLYGASVSVFDDSFFAPSTQRGTAQVQVCVFYSIENSVTLEISLVDAVGFGGNFASLAVGNQSLGVSDPKPIPMSYTRPQSPVSAWNSERMAVKNVIDHQKISDTAGNFNGSIDSDGLGGAVATIGDLDNDGIVDLAVGADFDDDGGMERGAVWIMFMNADGTVKASQRISDTRGNFNGSLTDLDHFGVSVTGLGDLDGDGIEDIVTGAWRDDEGGNDNTGALWVLFLNIDGTVKAHQKINTVQGGFQGELTNFDHFGGAVANLGDLDKDGVVDLAVGAWRDDDGGGSNHGAVWILFMNTDGTVKSHQKISDTEGGFTAVLNDEDRFGASVANVGDVNGDGITDMAVGSELVDDGGVDRGAVWILFLDTNGKVKGYQKISETQGSFGGTLNDGDGFGVSVAGVGDLNGDQVPDIAVGEIGAGAGSLWVIYLNRNGTARDAIEIGEGIGGFTGNLNSGDRFGHAVDLIGDLDGDGRFELAVGAPGDDDGGDMRGALWVLFTDRSPTAIQSDNVFVYIESPTVSSGGGVSRIGVGDPANPLWVIEEFDGVSGLREGDVDLDNSSAFSYSLINISEARSYLPPSPERPWFIEFKNRSQSDQDMVVSAVTFITDSFNYYTPDLPIRKTLNPQETYTLFQTGTTKPPLLQGYNIYEYVGSGTEPIRLLDTVAPYRDSYVHVYWDKDPFFCCPLNYLMEAVFDDSKGLSRVAYAHFNLSNGASRFTTEFVNTETLATGGMWVDTDADGLSDHLFVPRADAGYNKLYRNVNNGVLQEISNWDGANRNYDSQGAVWGDYNNDGFPDLYVANARQTGELYQNVNGSLQRVSSAQPSKDNMVAQGASWADFNKDGYLDLFVAVIGKNVLYRNEGGNVFTPVLAAEVGGWIDEVSSSSGGYWSDYDKDGDPDLFITSLTENAPNMLIHNQYMETGRDTFVHRENAGLAIRRGRSMSASWGDYDNDGFPDLFVANEDSDSNPNGQNWLYRNSGPPEFTFQLQSSAIGTIATAGGRSSTSSWGDVENDGDLDLFTTRDGSSAGTNYPDQREAQKRNRFAIFVNQNNQFEEPEIGNYSEYNAGLRGFTWDDINDDGYSDMFLADVLGSTSLNFVNNKRDDPDLNKWVRIVLVPSVSNSTAIGSKVTLRTALGSQYREVTSLTGRGGQSGGGLIFGLGKQTFVEEVEVIWPTGAISRVMNIAEGDLEESLFIQEPIPAGSVALTSPGADAEQIDPLVSFSWAAASNADRYQLQVSTDEQFSDLVVDVSNIESLTYTLGTPLDIATRYLWRVRGSGAGGPGPWGSSSFTTVAPSGTLTLSVPSAGATEVDPLVAFEWTEASNATRYHLQVSTDAGFSNLIVDLENIQELTFALTAPLDLATTYRWRVRGIGPGGPGPWLTSSFTTQSPVPMAPGQLQTTTNSDGGVFTATFSWGAVSFVDTYQFQLSQDMSFEPAGLLVDLASLEEESYSPSINWEGGITYYWRIRGVGPGGNGAWGQASFLAPDFVSTEDESLLPKHHQLGAIYPNPFSSTTTFRVDISEPEHATLAIYDLTGRKVVDVLDRFMATGRHRITWNAGGFPSGTYVVRLKVGSIVYSRPLTLVR